MRKSIEKLPISEKCTFSQESSYVFKQKNKQITLFLMNYMREKEEVSEKTGVF